MSTSSFIKSLLPPISLPFFRVLRSRIFISFKNIKPPYRSIVSHTYDELDLKIDNVWESENWIKHVEKTLISQFQDSPNIHQSAVIKSILILSNLYKNSKISLYDFGGGCGVLAPHVEKIAKKFSLTISTNIIDSESNIKLGERYLLDFKNIQFFNHEKYNLTQIMSTSDFDSTIILNMSSVLQYIHPYDEFLSSVLKTKKPKIVCITRFPRCEDSEIDAFAIQDITSSMGFCGSTIVNLFGKNSLIKIMNRLGFEILFEEFNSIGDTNYFVQCSDNNFKRMTMVSYTFIAVN